MIYMYNNLCQRTTWLLLSHGICYAVGKIAIKEAEKYLCIYIQTFLPLDGITVLHF